MKADLSVAVQALNRRFLLDYPGEAARRIDAVPPEEAAALFASVPIHIAVPVWEHLAPDTEERLLDHLPDAIIRPLLTELEPHRSSGLLSRLDRQERERIMALLDPHVEQELRGLMGYPPDSAGNLMDPRIIPFRADMTVQETVARLRSLKQRDLRVLFLVDHESHLSGYVELHDLVLADGSRMLQSLSRPIAAAIPDLAPREEVVEKLEQFKLTVIPVVDFSGRLVGVIRQAGLVAALQEETSLDIQTMVGVSKEERALSKIPFAVRKRLPWLEINLLTAFLAASVVGLFESTIAKFTALAVLLPVVAGQSGNAGAQALAVTMRGLALREIGARHWKRVVFKEVSVGLLNGLAIAFTTGIAVFFWSNSSGLGLIIAASMVLAMIAAGFAGAIIPIMLTRLGQDPAQSSSIVLTTVTDVVGFFSFLGIASALAGII